MDDSYNPYASPLTTFEPPSTRPVTSQGPPFESAHGRGMVAVSLLGVMILITLGGIAT